MKPDYTDYTWGVDDSSDLDKYERLSMKLFSAAMLPVNGSGSTQSAVTYAAADAALTADSFGTTAIKSLKDVGVAKHDMLLSAAIGELNALVEQLSAPSTDPGSDEYEDGYNACLALVVEFRDGLLRQEKEQR